MTTVPEEKEQFPYIFPLQIDADGLTILDATRSVVIPNISYRGDVGHIVRQKTVINMIAAMMNESRGYVLDPSVYSQYSYKPGLRWVKPTASAQAQGFKNGKQNGTK